MKARMDTTEIFIDGQNWYARSQSASIRSLWHTLSGQGKAAFVAFVLLALGVPLTVALRSSGASPQDLDKNTVLQEQARTLVSDSSSDPESHQMVEDIKGIASQDQPSVTQEDVAPAEPQAEPQTELQVAANDHSYIISRIGDEEYRILSEVANEYGLTGVARKLFFSIRIIEGGGGGYGSGTAGLEMGVGDGIEGHPSRRHAGNFDESLKLQGQWAAGTVVKRLPSDDQEGIEAFAKRYCQTNWENWLRMAMSFLRSGSDQKG